MLNPMHVILFSQREIKIITLIVYVYSVEITEICPTEIQLLKHNLATEIEIKDLGKLGILLGHQRCKR